MFRRGDLGGIRIGRRRNGLRLIARARVNASRFCGSDVIAVGVTEQNHMHVAKPRIRRTGYSLSGVVKNPHSRRILKKHRPVVLTKFPVMGAQRGDLHVLGLKLGWAQDSYEHHRRDYF